jgi:hypothetical protein
MATARDISSDALKGSKNDGIYCCNGTGIAILLSRRPQSFFLLLWPSTLGDEL